MSNFKWCGKKVHCYIPELDRNGYDFYRSFCLNNEIFEVGDFAVLGEKNNSVARFLGFVQIQKSNSVHYQGIIRKFLWPFELTHRQNPKRIKLDGTNEVIEDVRESFGIVSLLKIDRKCRVVYATEEDPADLIHQSKLNKNLFFSCRFKIEHEQIEPLFSESNIANTKFDEFTLLDLENASYALNKTPDKKLRPKRKSVLNPIVLSSDSEDSEKARSPKNRNKSIKLTPNSSAFKMLAQRNSAKKDAVKRNLSESFNSSNINSQTNTPVLNYSIVDEDEENSNGLKLKVRLSSKQSLTTYSNSESNSEKEDLLPKITIRLPNILKPVVKLKDEDKKVVDNMVSNNEALTSKSSDHKKYRGRTCDDVSDESEDAHFVEIVDRRRSTRTPKNTPTSTRPKRRATLNINYDLMVSPEKSLKTIVSTPTTKTSQRNLNSVRKSILKTAGNLEYGTPKKSVSLAEHPEVCEVSTPKSTRTQKDTPSKKTKRTPNSTARLIKDGTITPSMKSRDTEIKKVDTPLSVARSQLHVSFVPEALPCREKEFSDIFNFLEDKLLDECGGCMYISGVPGTGKTATVTEVIRKLQKAASVGKLSEFEYVNINGMRLTEPRQSYVEILKQLSGKTVAWEQAQSILNTKFTKTSKNKKPVVLVVDELDILCTKRQDVVYNILDWPTKATAQLIVITIANTMDLPERLLMGRVTSRLGLTRLTFQAYTHKQLQEIVTQRLSGTNVFNPDAVQLVARKVASVSGDARRALDICRRAAEIAEKSGPQTLVSMVHVNEALNAMITQPKIQAIKRCSRLEKAILQAVIAEVERTGVEETNVLDVLTMLVSIAAIDGFKMVSTTAALGAIARLGACRLLLTDQKSHDMDQRIILNISADDVYYALRKDE